MELRRFRLFEAKRDLREVGPQRRSYELVLESRGCIRGYVTGIIVLQSRLEGIIEVLESISCSMREM